MHAPCSVQEHVLDFVMQSELHPRQRVKYGGVEVWAPAKGKQILTRNLGHSWAHSIFRSFSSHVASAKQLKKPFESCKVSFDSAPAEDRKWLQRPALPMFIPRQ